MVQRLQCTACIGSHPQRGQYGRSIAISDTDLQTTKVSCRPAFRTGKPTWVHRRCREGKSREALQGVGNLRTLELRSTPLFDSRSGWSLKQDLLPANFWTKCPEKPAKGHSHHEHDDPPESRLPRLAWPRQCCLHRPKTNSIVWWRIWRSSGDIELMLSALRFNPFLQGPLRLHELLHIRTATSRVRIQWCPSVRTVAAACALFLLSLQSESACRSVLVHAVLSIC
jgi:hypothetical protein